MRVYTRDILLAKTDSDMNEAIAAIEMYAKLSEQSFNDLRQSYTGNKQDIDIAYAAFVKWNTRRQKNLNLAKLGEVEKFMESVSNEGDVGILRNEMIDQINHISDTSQTLAEQRFTQSQKIKERVVSNFILLVAIIIFVVLIIAYFLFKNVQIPVKEMIASIKEYKNGNSNIRNNETITTEINVLANAFNELFDHFEEEKTLQQNYSQLSTLMLSEINAHKFFNNLLSSLCQSLSTQIGGVYVLSRDKSHYYLYESVGMKMSKIDFKFNAHLREGEFGEVLTTKRIAYIKSLPINTHFIFQTSAGDIVPRELINIPIVIAGEVAAIIALASVRNIDRRSEKLLEKSFDVITARVDGVLSYRRMRKFAEELEVKSKQLADSSAYNRALIEASIDPMLTIDKSGIITDVNSALCSITSTEKHELIGKTFQSLFVDASAATDSYKEAFEYGMLVNHENQIAGEHQIPVLFNASVFKDAEQ
jgi:PAS domain-containing protein/HAMP domain-containing protein